MYKAWCNLDQSLEWMAVTVKWQVWRYLGQGRDVGKPRAGWEMNALQCIVTYHCILVGLICMICMICCFPLTFFIWRGHSLLTFLWPCGLAASCKIILWSQNCGIFLLAAFKVMSTATFTEAMVWLRREICAQQEWMPKPKGFLGFGFLGTVLQHGIFQNEYLTRGFSFTFPNAFPTVFYMTEGYRIHQTRHKLIHFPRVRDFWHLNSCDKRLVSTPTGEQRGAFLHGGSRRSAALIDPIIQNTGWLGYDWS